MKVEDKPIGFFDSGVGGISVLKEAVKVLPNENFIYFGDSANAPYGVKTVNEVKKLTFNAVEFLIKKNVKAIVIACNTATSAAITDLRDKYEDSMPVIGIEPALKPAVELKRKGKIIIMATPMTLSEVKFKNLMDNYADVSDIMPLPCPGLVELIESGNTDGDEVREYLNRMVKPYEEEGIAAIVLGCTHYPFIKESMRKVLDSRTPIIDGSIGTARQLERQLTEHKIKNNSDSKGSVEIFNSLDDEGIMKLSYHLFEY